MLSIHPQYIDEFMSGKKTLELRTRNVNVSSGDQVWMYSTMPRGTVEILGVVDDVLSMTPEEMWQQHSKELGITKTSFMSYYKGRDKAYAIRFKEIKHLNNTVSLSELRESGDTFFPPQFFCRLNEKKNILKLLNQGLSLQTA